jgi:23S rRNA (cytosine1962-C5)-methyltransferase
VPTPETSGSVFLKAGRDRRVHAGHLWIYRGEIGRTSGDCAPGSVVSVLDPRGRFLGRGHFNPASLITVRLFTRRRDEAVDAGLVRRRIAAAIAYRRNFYETGDACRLVFSEGDWLPGLVVDRYGGCLVVQLGTLGMDRMREAVVGALQDAVHPRGIYERSDLPTRAHEGLPPVTGLLAGEVPDEVPVTIDGVQLVVPLKEGQKTGLYLDHRDTRRLVRSQADGRRVLDVFCNAGAFALHALRGGAREAIGIESAPEALTAARRNADLNGFADKVRLIDGNAFERLRELEKAGERFDLVVLDPPAFTKSVKSVAGARRGYKEINLRALRLASPGGLVMTASCSYHLGPEEFLEVVREAAADAGRPVTLVTLGGQAPDHPVNLGVPETRYLKTVLLAVRD